MNLYLLWEEILDGYNDAPTLHGVFDGLAAIEAHMKGRYFDFRLLQPIEFNFGEPGTRVSVGSSTNYLSHVWYEIRQLNEANENYIVNGKVVLRGKPTTETKETGHETR